MRFVWSLIRRAKCWRCSPFIAPSLGKVFEKAADHGQWRAQFVRDVGDEGAAHRFDASGVGDVEADQQLVPVTQGERTNGIDAGARRGRLEDEWRMLLRAREILGEARRAHQLLDDRAAVARQINAEMVACRAIAPLDLVTLVQDHQAIGNDVHGIPEGSQSRLEFLPVTKVVPQAARKLQEDSPQAPRVSGNSAPSGPSIHAASKARRRLWEPTTKSSANAAAAQPQTAPCITPASRARPTIGRTPVNNRRVNHAPAGRHRVVDGKTGDAPSL
jgi:hypothetical protein